MTCVLSLEARYDLCLVLGGSLWLVSCPWRLAMSFVDVESVQGPQLSSEPLSFNTLGRFQMCCLANCGPPNCRLYLPGYCLRADNLFAFILETYIGDCGGIPWYLEQTSGHALQSIPGGCFRVRVALAPVSFSSVGWYNCCSK
jgi:hypothetical protein